MGYSLVFTELALRDLEDHKKGGNKPVLKKLKTLLTELIEHPYTGTGKPEQLKHELTGLWSRRITKEHRLVYEVLEDRVVVLSVKGHY